MKPGRKRKLDAIRDEGASLKINIWRPPLITKKKTFLYIGAFRPHEGTDADH